MISKFKGVVDPNTLSTSEGDMSLPNRRLPAKEKREEIIKNYLQSLVKSNTLSTSPWITKLAFLSFGVFCEIGH